MSLTLVIKKLQGFEDLSKEDLYIIFHEFEKKSVDDEDIKKLVISWREKKETASEIVQLAEILLSKQKQIKGFENALDICGTGGDKTNTFNISTLTAIVASSCGIKVIKHSGKSTTSISGSVDILNQFGLDTDKPVEIKENCLKKTNLMFVSSNILRDTFSAVKKVCKKLAVSGFVNLLGPLTNPYKTKYHLLGVSSLEWGKLMAQALLLQNKKEALVFCSKTSESIFLDELSFCGKNYIWKLENGNIKEEIIEPESLGQNLSDLNELKIKNHEESKSVFEAILRGKLNSNNSKVKTVALNTACALYLTKKAKTITNGFNYALEHIQTGKAWEHFQNFLNCNKLG